MEISTGLRITISELPSRPRRLDDAELQAIFGGCLISGVLCFSNHVCCSCNCVANLLTPLGRLTGGALKYCSG